MKTFVLAAVLLALGIMLGLMGEACGGAYSDLRESDTYIMEDADGR